MKAETAAETVHHVLVKMTAEEARQLAKDVADSASALRDVASQAHAMSHDGRERYREAANRLEVFASALGVALAQLPKEGA